LSSLFFGKFIILGGSDESAVLLPSEELVAMVVVMDVMAACWFVYHLGFMLRLPVLGPRFAVLDEDGGYALATYPWVRRAAFVGLVVFVMVPFAMTGSVGGSILARLLEMTHFSMNSPHSRITDYGSVGSGTGQTARCQMALLSAEKVRMVSNMPSQDVMSDEFSPAVGGSGGSNAGPSGVPASGNAW